MICAISVLPSASICGNPSLTSPTHICSSRTIQHLKIDHRTFNIEHYLFDHPQKPDDLIIYLSSPFCYQLHAALPTVKNFQLPFACSRLLILFFLQKKETKKGTDKKKHRFCRGSFVEQLCIVISTFVFQC